MKEFIMETKKPTPVQKNAGTKLRELSKKRRENMKPSKELFEILQNPVKPEQEDKKSARPLNDDVDAEA